MATLNGRKLRALGDESCACFPVGWSVPPDVPGCGGHRLLICLYRKKDKCTVGVINTGKLDPETMQEVGGLFEYHPQMCVPPNGQVQHNVALTFSNVDLQ